MAFTPSVELGIRQYGEDTEVGRGLDVGLGLVVADGVTGLAVDVRVRRLLVHQADGFEENGVSVSVSYDPTPKTPLGFTARVAPAWSGDAMSGADALWGRESRGGMGQARLLGGGGNRLDTELGYGLPIGARFIGTPRVGLRTSEYGRGYRVRYGMQVLEQGKLNLELRDRRGATREPGVPPAGGIRRDGPARARARYRAVVAGRAGPWRRTRTRHRQADKAAGGR